MAATSHSARRRISLPGPQPDARYICETPASAQLPHRVRLRRNSFPPTATARLSAPKASCRRSAPRDVLSRSWRLLPATRRAKPRPRQNRPRMPRTAATARSSFATRVSAPPTVRRRPRAFRSSPATRLRPTRSPQAPRSAATPAASRFPAPTLPLSSRAPSPWTTASSSLSRETRSEGGAFGPALSIEAIEEGKRDSLDCFEPTATSASRRVTR